jgi:hypothetical protein
MFYSQIPLFPIIALANIYKNFSLINLGLYKLGLEFMSVRKLKELTLKLISSSPGLDKLGCALALYTK